jgi:hypothetical protein
VERDWNRATVRTYTTVTTRLKRPAVLLTRLLLLFQTDDSQAVSPNLADRDGLKDPKFLPSRVTWKAPLMGNETSREVTLNAAPENENTPVRDPRLRRTDAVAGNPTPTPFAVRHATRVSLCHRVDTHDDLPIRTLPLQSDSPALAPNTETLICAVEGCADGDTLVTKRGYNSSGKLTSGCVCNGHPPASNVDTLTPAAAADAAAFVNPATVHTTAAAGDAGAAAVDRFSSSRPVDGMKAADTVPVDGLRLEQEGGAAVALRAEKRKPVMEMRFKALEFREGAATKDNVNATPVVAAT